MIQSENKVDIIITFPAICTVEEYNKALDVCCSHHFTYYRFNLAKFIMTEDEYEYCFKKYQQLKERIPEAKVIIDIPNPRKRLRLFSPKTRVDIKKGDNIICYNQKINDDMRYILVNDFREYFKLYHEYLYQDGDACFSVQELEKDKVVFRCQNDFCMKNGKAITSEQLIDNDLSENVQKLICDIQPEQVWISFVESGMDIKNVSEQLPGVTDFYAKIESQRGVDRIDHILEEECNLVVARGDLGLGIDIADLYDVQQLFYKKQKSSTVRHILRLTL